MKNLKLLLILLCPFFVGCSTYHMSLNIPAKEKLMIDYPNYDAFTVALTNKSLTTLDVKVVSKLDEKRIRSFGLNAKGTAKVLVEKENHLVLVNNSKQTVKLRLTREETERIQNKNEKNYVSFKLENKGPKSIPLIIPTVMNPNLSPFSKSAVTLKMGQKILFKNGIKRYELLTVNERINDGDVLNIVEILEKRKRELGLIN